MDSAFFTMTKRNPDNEAPTTALPKVLVIDDSTLIRKAVVKVLGSEFSVIAAVDGREGLEILKKDRTIKLVITDLMMPNIDGYGVIKAIRGSKNEALKTLPIIVITGNSDPNTVKLQALDLGASDFLTKPFTSADLLARTRSFMQYQAEVKTLQKLVAREPVSGLITKKPFDIQLEKDISRVVRHREPLAVMLIELQDAKSLLDTLGDARGSSLIKMITGVLTKSVRKEDTLARLNTGVFAISLPSANTAGATELAHRIFNALNSIKIKNKGQIVPMSVVLGMCAIDKDCCPTIEPLYKNVKGALVAAKNKKTERIAIELIKKTAPTAKALPPISIDELLQGIERGERQKAAKEMSRALKRLKPLLEMMSKEQKAQFLK